MLRCRGHDCENSNISVLISRASARRINIIKELELKKSVKLGLGVERMLGVGMNVKDVLGC